MRNESINNVVILPNQAHVLRFRGYAHLPIAEKQEWITVEYVDNKIQPQTSLEPRTYDEFVIGWYKNTLLILISSKIVIYLNLSANLAVCLEFMWHVMVQKYALHSTTSYLSSWSMASKYNTMNEMYVMIEIFVITEKNTRKKQIYYYQWFMLVAFTKWNDACLLGIEFKQQFN